MSSNLKVNTILPSTGTTIGIGTVGGLINIVGNIDVNSTSGISTFNGIDVTGVVNSTVAGGENKLKIETTSSGNPVLNLNAAGAGGHEIEYIRSSNTLNFKQGGGSVRMSIAANGDLLPGTDSQYNIGSNAVRFANIYADTLYGDGSNLTGISAGTSLSGSTNNTVCTVTGANAIKGEANLTFNGGETGDAQLTVHAAEANANSDSELILETSNDFATSVVMFKDSTAEAGSIAYNHGDNYIKLSTNGTNGGTERLRIRSDGKISAGTSLNASNTYEFSLTGADATGGFYAHGRNHYLSNRSNAYASLTLKKSNSDSDATDYFQLRDSSNNLKASISGAGNWKPIAGGGIDFSATGDASGMTSELLDDYEEGSFTPTYSNTGGVTPNYNYQEGFYTKIGNLVTCAGIIGCTNANSFGTGKRIQIQLPFTSASNSYGIAGGALCDGKGFQNVFSGNMGVGTQVGNSHNYGRLVTLASSPSNVYYTGTPGLQNDHYFRFRYIYHVS